MHAWSRYWIIGRFTPHFNFSAFRILPTIPHPFPHFSIPHFTFRIPHSAFRNSAFYQWPAVVSSDKLFKRLHIFPRNAVWFPLYSFVNIPYISFLCLLIVLATLLWWIKMIIPQWCGIVKLTRFKSALQSDHLAMTVPAVWVKKIPPEILWQFFQNTWKFFDQISHAYYTFLSTLDYKFLFNYLQLWRSYAILSTTTIMCSKCPPSTETHAGWSHLIWHNFVKVADNNKNL